MYLRLLTTSSCANELIDGPEEFLVYENTTACWPSIEAGDERAMLVDTLTYLPDDILTKVDRASMSVSLEVRTPFLDEDLYRFAWRLPWCLPASGRRRKSVLREVMQQTRTE